MSHGIEEGVDVAPQKAGEPFDEERFVRAYGVASRILDWDKVTALYPSHNTDGNPAYLRAFNTFMAFAIRAAEHLDAQGIVATIPETPVVAPPGGPHEIQ